MKNSILVKIKQKGIISFLIISIILLFNLQAQENERTQENLIEKLKHPNFNVRTETAVKISKTENVNFNDLLNLLKLDDQNIKINTVLALGLMGDNRAVEPLLDLLNDPDPGLQIEVIKALSRIGDKKALKELSKIKKKTHPMVQKYILCSQEIINAKNGNSPKKIIDFLLEKQNPQFVIFAIESLGSVGDNTSANWLIRIWDNDKSNQFTPHINSALLKLNDKAVDALITALNKSYNSFRTYANAITVLKKIKNKKAVPILKNIMNGKTHVYNEHEKNYLIILATGALAEMGDEQARELLYQNIKDGINSHQALYSAQALAEAGDEKGLLRLLSALKEKNSSYINQIINTLSKTKDPRAKEVLYKMVQSKDKSMAITACTALVPFKDERAVKRLIELLKEEYRKTYSYYSGTSLIKVLSAYQEKAIEPLITLLNNSNINIKIQAINAINLMKPDRRTFEPMMKIIHSTNKALAESAFLNIIRLKDKKAIPVFIEHLKDSNQHICQLSSKGLLNIGKPAIEPLFQVLNDEEYDKSRHHILKILGLLGDDRITKQILSELKKDLSQVETKSIFTALNTQQLSFQDYISLTLQFITSSFGNQTIKQHIIKDYYGSIMLLINFFIFLMLILLYNLFGSKINASAKDYKKQINKKENLFRGICLYIAFNIWAVLLGIILLNAAGILIIIILIGLGILLMKIIGDLILKASLNGMCVKIDKNQYKELYNIIEDLTKKYSLKSVPECYLYQAGGVLGIIFKRLIVKDTIIITSKLVELLKENAKEEIKALIADQMIRMKRRDILLKWIIAPSFILFLFPLAYYRARQYTHDQINISLAEEKSILDSILIMSVGSSLYKKINKDKLIDDIKELKGFWYKIFHLFQFQPYYVNRILNIKKQ